jgi:hypothetical protein
LEAVVLGAFIRRRELFVDVDIDISELVLFVFELFFTRWLEWLSVWSLTFVGATMSKIMSIQIHCSSAPSLTVPGCRIEKTPCCSIGRHTDVPEYGCARV